MEEAGVELFGVPSYLLNEQPTHIMNGVEELHRRMLVVNLETA
jgi:hypothetical protein